MESFEQKLARVLSEPIELVEYDPIWPSVFESESNRLAGFFPASLIRRIGPVGGEQLGLLSPHTLDITGEHIRGARSEAVVVIGEGANHGGVSGQRDRVAEVVVRGPVGGEQLGHFGGRQPPGGYRTDQERQQQGAKSIFPVFHKHGLVLQFRHSRIGDPTDPGRS